MEKTEKLSKSDEFITNESHLFKLHSLCQSCDIFQKRMLIEWLCGLYLCIFFFPCFCIY